MKRKKYIKRMSLTLLAFAELVQTGRAQEIPDIIIDRVMHLMDTKSLIKLLETDVREHAESHIAQRKEFYPYVQGTPRMRADGVDDFVDDYMFSCFSPDVANVTIIQAQSQEEADRKALSFGIWFRDPNIPEFPEGSEGWMYDDTGRFKKESPVDALSALAYKESSVFIHYEDGTMNRIGVCQTRCMDFYNNRDYDVDYTWLPEVSGLSLLTDEDYSYMLYDESGYIEEDIPGTNMIRWYIREGTNSRKGVRYSPKRAGDWRD